MMIFNPKIKKHIEIKEKYADKMAELKYEAITLLGKLHDVEIKALELEYKIREELLQEKTNE